MLRRVPYRALSCECAGCLPVSFYVRPYASLICNCFPSRRPARSQTNVLKYIFTASELHGGIISKLGMHDHQPRRSQKMVASDLLVALKRGVLPVVSSGVWAYTAGRKYAARYVEGSLGLRYHCTTQSHWRARWFHEVGD